MYVLHIQLVFAKKKNWASVHSCLIKFSIFTCRWKFTCTKIYNSQIFCTVTEICSYFVFHAYFQMYICVRLNFHLNLFILQTFHGNLNRIFCKCTTVEQWLHHQEILYKFFDVFSHVLIVELKLLNNRKFNFKSYFAWVDGTYSVLCQKKILNLALHLLKI